MATSSVGSWEEGSNMHLSSSIIDLPSANTPRSRHLQKDGRKNVVHPVGRRELESNTQRYQSWSRKVRESYASKTAQDWLNTLLPITKWIQTYDYKNNLVTDVLSGLTVGVMIIPQSMSYAKLAGLPVEFGLYSALLPVYAYALFGTSRQLAVGPVAMLSLMLSTGLTNIVDPENVGAASFTEEQNTRYQILAVQTAFLLGVSYILMGIFKLGFITIFLSHAVVSGFTTGAAVIIGLSQVKYLFGFDIPKGKLHEFLYNIFANIEKFNYRTFLMGMSGILILVGMKHIGKKYPQYKWVRAAGPLTVTVLHITITWSLNLENKGIDIVGNIPKGLPSSTIHMWSPLQDIDKLWPTVVSMVIVGFMESIAIAKQLASKHKYDLDSSLELIGLGMANFVGAMFSAYPVTGSFSRSAVNNESGAKSGISAIVTASLVAIILLFLTFLFEHMPLATLASIVISGVLGLLDYPEAIHLFKVHKFDFMVWCVACLGTLFLGVEAGLAIAVGVSLLIVTYESAYPHTALLGRLPGTTIYRNIKQYPEAKKTDGILCMRIDAPIYFANTQHVREKLIKYMNMTPDVHTIIMDLAPVSHIDTSGLHILDEIFDMYKERGVKMCFCNPNHKVMQRFELAGFDKKVGVNNFFVSMYDGVSKNLYDMESQFESGSQEEEKEKEEKMLNGEAETKKEEGEQER